MTTSGTESASDNRQDKSYRVLARKYRPAKFEDLVGQDAMVRTLRAAFETGRVAHAYMLTGVRGVGKTTTARLLARALNYTDEAGQSTPSVDFSTPGKNCQDILEGVHMDVQEMDAASRTGIDDIREIIDAAKFTPAIGAYKVYIIDEVHMLSKAAFNGLLKILEEPPPHVKFIFATTEIRKVPVTILSRCQRFDLKRIEPNMMIGHLQSVCEQEGVQVDDKAMALITRAAEGSVRDALSLLDQAIAQGLAQDGRVHSGNTTSAISEVMVRDMLGLADRERVLDLLDMLFKGDAAAALNELKSQYDLGADPLEVLRDMLELVNWLTRLSVVGNGVQDGSVSETQMMRGQEMVQSIGMNVLARAWQVLLKGLNEAQTAPRPFAAVEMVLVRFCYIANIPAPDELIRQLQTGQGATTPHRDAPQADHRQAVDNSAREPTTTDAQTNDTQPNDRQPSAALKKTQSPERLDDQRPYASAAGLSLMDSRGSASQGAGVSPAAHIEQENLEEQQAHEPETVMVMPDVPNPQSFDDVVALISDRRDLHLLFDVECYVHLVRFEPYRIEFHPSAEAPDKLAGRLSQALEKWTGKRWVVSVSNEEGQPTINEQRAQQAKELEVRLRQTPLAQAAFEIFPDAQVVRVEEKSIDHTDTDTKKN